MSIRNLYPKARPQTIYNVINGRPELPAASTFSRASEATYVDAGGIIQTAAVDEPRFNYDPVTGEFLGLLIEESRTNLLRYSEDLSQWTAIDNATLSSAPSSPGTTNASRVTSTTSATWARAWSPIYSGSGGNTVGSVYLRTDTPFTASLRIRYDSAQVVIQNVSVTTEWQRFSVNVAGSFTNSADFMIFLNADGVSGTSVNGRTLDIWGVQLEEGSFPTSYIPTSGTTVTREPDAFSLTTSTNYDGGFSLLLDSETTTEDFIYKVKASGVTIAELNNASGTLDWNINGQSAAINGEYPQVGAIQPGRVRTVSSFGAADGTTQVNYLYTTGLSFPTNAIVAPGADELEFGPGQTLKAAYLWNGQLSNTEAVSVIKGEYNIVPSEPIKADSYSFVYNTDPTSIGETSITLPYIVPTVSMRVYWGDGTNSAYEQGVTPSHTYPYPGQYRIQIEADDGFDDVKLSDVNDTITRIDQWAPQHRVGAAGDGFTGDDLYKILYYQTTNAQIPPFKYTGLTTIEGAFYANPDAAVNGWNWVPINLQSCTSVTNAFGLVGRDTGDANDQQTFPQLQTTNVLEKAIGTFGSCQFTEFPTNGLPFSNSSGINDWSSCFSNMGQLQTIGPIDTSAATNITSIFKSCGQLTNMPVLDTQNVTNFSSAWYGCSKLTSFPQIDTSSGENFQSTWLGCSSLTSFPLIDTSSGTNFSYAWNGCSGLTSFPAIDLSAAEDMGYAFQGCDQMVENNIPAFTNATSVSGLYYDCLQLTTVATMDFSNATSTNALFRGCSAMTDVTGLKVDNTITMSSAFYKTQITSFPSGINWPKCEQFINTWLECSSLTDVPTGVFDTTGVLQSDAFDGAFKDCALTAQSIENILVSLDTNGQSNIELGIDSGTNAAKSTWTAAANTAYTNLINKGWTITFNP